MGDPVRVLAEDLHAVLQDAGQVSLVGTASLDWCREHLGVDADRRRIRPNLVVETERAVRRGDLDRRAERRRRPAARRSSGSSGAG